MRIVTLLENTSIASELKAKHGISFYIDTGDKKILFDAGPDQAYLENAEKLNIDLSAVDYMVLSHGHSDHGGGLESFMKINPNAGIYLKDTAINSFYFKLFGIFKINIGLPIAKLDLKRMEFVTGNLKIDDSIQIFTGFHKSGFIPHGNLSLYTKDSSGKLTHDSFDHEISLLITSKGKNILFTGCSHSGLGNIVRSVKEQSGVETIDIVIGGFHLYDPVTKKTEPDQRIDQLIEELNDFKQTKFYTGHCTGSKAFEYLKTLLGERVSEFKTGMELIV